MNKIDLLKDKYEILPVNAVIEGNTIIPGKRGKTVDLDKSYENMKASGIFREESLIYKDLLPSEILLNNKDKYIIKGNSSNNKVALIVILNANNIDKVKELDNITVFLNHNDVTIDNIKKLKSSVYTYGSNGIYSEDILMNDNIIINRTSNNKSLYCLLKEKNINTLNICNKKNMYGVIPNIIGDYSEVKNNLSSGSIILLNNINNLDIIIKYIEGKGYEIVPLSKLLEE